MAEQATAIDKTREMLQLLCSEEFFGDVVIKLSGGKVAEVRINQVVKPNEL
jgi:hypothetical protein